ncbi:hypothetical protein [Sulfurimonas sp. HSL-1716]|uniref:hypothetical protein n=1 Tax=Hydrocurvibacter sulfurireducens TaxID=3131937 RepID=UPI0031F76321
MFSIPSFHTIKQYAVDIFAVLLGGALAVLFIMYMIARSDLKTAQQDYANEKASYTQAVGKVDELTLQNTENLQQIGKLKADNASLVEALNKKSHADIKRTQKITKIKTRIEDAKKTDDGPVAPVLFDTLYRLQQSAGAEDSNRS